MQPHLLAVAQQRDGAVENGTAVADIAAEREQASVMASGLGGARTSVTPTSLKVAAIGACGLWMVTRIETHAREGGQDGVGDAPAAASISR